MGPPTGHVGLDEGPLGFGVLGDNWDGVCYVRGMKGRIVWEGEIIW